MKKILNSRLFWFGMFLIMLLLIVVFTPIGQWISVDNMREVVENTGKWSYLLFVLIFVAAAVMNVPGTAFLLLGILLFGYFTGALLSYFAALSGSIITFFIGRWLGGNALQEIANPKLTKWIESAKVKPVSTLILLRTLLQFSPFIGYALSLTDVKFRYYLLGNMIGFLVPTLYISFGLYFFEDYILYLFG